jgi:hypothetical protein
MKMKKRPKNIGASPSKAEVVSIPLQNPWSALDGVLWYFAVLAYPSSSESDKREKFVKAMHAWRLKNYIRQGGNRLAVPPEDRRMKNEKIHGTFRLGLARIDKRLMAGSIGWSLYANGMSFRYAEPTSRGTVGVELRGQGTITEALRRLIDQKEQETGVHYGGKYGDERPVLENARHHVWVESLPVLHLAIALHLRIENFPPEYPLWSRLLLLLYSPDWLPDALICAEGFRSLLQSRVLSFDPEKALRLIPANN